MSNLGKLLALQAGAKKKESTNESHAKDQSPVREPTSPENTGGIDAAAHESVELPSVDSPAPAPAPAADKPAIKAGGFKLTNKLAGIGNRNAGSVPATPANIPARPTSSSTPAPDSGASDVAEFGLADLAGFDAGSVNEVRSDTLSWFEDEIEATAPDRPLDPDLTTQQLGFVESLDNIYQVLNDPELFGQSVRIIMMELQENPEYIKLIQDQDVHVMIRAMRNTMGMARIKKQEKSRKAGTGTRKAAQKKSRVSEADLSILNSLLGGAVDD